MVILDCCMLSSSEPFKFQPSSLGIAVGDVEGAVAGIAVSFGLGQALEGLHRVVYR